MLDLTQAALAVEVGVGARTLYELERGNGNIETVELLVAYLSSRGITFAQLDGESGWALFNRNLVGTFDDEKRKNRAARSNSSGAHQNAGSRRKADG
ncbi:helix-turn-helix domain-containing protein [Rhizobium tumorigenes]|uniref:helix-turn-helix domain-containing protein n=1 Tax=Rhizobium tumorigenes TaxID=2041385 RepID=UPI00241C01D6|nr:helix-turn-helix transcriptional regulator [Rhizobium tumorigenes]WFR99558.1 helix-turn-helix transcriptional regulator [Rhizobium tumorigenes]